MYVVHYPIKKKRWHWLQTSSIPTTCCSGSLFLHLCFQVLLWAHKSCLHRLWPSKFFKLLFKFLHLSKECMWCHDNIITQSDKSVHPMTPLLKADCTLLWLNHSYNNTMKSSRITQQRSHNIYIYIKWLIIYFQNIVDCI